jgi:endonuclease-8
VSDVQLERCYATAADLLRRNLGGGPRTTRFVKDRAGRLWVYGRAGLPCLRCGERIRAARLGKDHRPTFWCPACQT